MDGASWMSRGDAGWFAGPLPDNCLAPVLRSRACPWQPTEFDPRLSSIDELTRTLGDNLGYLADGSDSERAGAVHRQRELLADRPQLEI
jgi:hypothetical protein